MIIAINPITKQLRDLSGRVCQSITIDGDWEHLCELIYELRDHPEINKHRAMGNGLAVDLIGSFLVQKHFHKAAISRSARHCE